MRNVFPVIVFGCLAAAAHADFILDALPLNSNPNIATTADFVLNDASLDPATTINAINQAVDWVEGVFSADGLTIALGGGREDNPRVANANNLAWNANLPIIGGSVLSRSGADDPPLTLDIEGLAALDVGEELVLTIYGIGDNIGQDTGFVSTYGTDSLTLETRFNTNFDDRADPTGNVPFVQFSYLTDGVTDAINIVTQASTNVDADPERQFINGFSLSIPGGGGGGGGNGDFNADGAYDCSDIDALVAEIAGGTNAAAFDLDSDGLVDGQDLTAWLLEAGEENIGPGRAYLAGDANLDGSVDVGDFNVWNGNKFTATPAWCSGDFNADGSVDVGDFNIWNGNKFQSSDHTSVVPEPGSMLLALLGLPLLCLRRRRRVE